MSNQKLHVLFLCGWYPSRAFPTNGDFIQRHAEAVNLTHYVSVLHIVSDKNMKKTTEVEIVKNQNIKTAIGYVKFTQNPIVKIFRFYTLFKKLLKEIGHFDVVHANTLYPFGIVALYLKKFRSIPYIISEHWTGYHVPQSRSISVFQKVISKAITKHASVVCPVTKDLQKSMQQLGLAGNYISVPNVVNTSIFKPTKKSNTNFTVIHVSDLNDSHKNISGMLKTAKLLEENIGEFTWKFIGGKSTKYDALISKLEFKKATIQFIHHISQEELATHFETANLFVLFSNYENLPCVILEAFASGTQVIATDVGGISEYFPVDFGCLVEAQNLKQLLKSILEVKNNPRINSEKMHNYAVDNFSKEVISTRFSHLYYSSLKKTV